MGFISSSDWSSSASFSTAQFLRSNFGGLEGGGEGVLWVSEEVFFWVFLLVFCAWGEGDAKGFVLLGEGGMVLWVVELVGVGLLWGVKKEPMRPPLLDLEDEDETEGDGEVEDCEEEELIPVFAPRLLLRMEEKKRS